MSVLRALNRPLGTHQSKHEGTLSVLPEYNTFLTAGIKHDATREYKFIQSTLILLKFKE